MVVESFFCNIVSQKNTKRFEYKNGVKIYMLCHEGTDFSHVVTEMAKNSTTATSNAHQFHFLVSRQPYMLHECRFLIFNNA